MSSSSATLLVTGGTGRLGRSFLEAATRAGHGIRIMSRREAPKALPPGTTWVRGDLVTGDGLEAAVRNAEVVVHAASDPRGDSRAVDVEGTRRLLEAALSEGVRHLVYPSIVGIDRLPYAYYEAKLAAERAIADSEVPHTIVRITQFHSFVDEMLDALPPSPMFFLPTRVLVQSIAVEEAADILLCHASGRPAGRAQDVGGPEVLTLGTIGPLLGPGAEAVAACRAPPPSRQTDPWPARGARDRP